MISLNIWSLVFTIINLIVLFLLLRKFLINPVNRIIQEREEMINNTIADANKTKSEAMQLKKEYEDTLSGVSAECEDIREKSRQEAKNEYARIMEEADAKSNRMIADAEKSIKMEREKAFNDMESQIADLAMTAATRIIGDSADTNRNQSLYDEFLEKAGDVHDTEDC
ncbi:MAG: F0F1 ATP synthase subunit B [Coprococcus sp.]